MPTVISHAVAATALGQFVPRRTLPRGFWLWTAVCAMLPDADVVGFSLGVPYGSMLGHRGLSHSLLAAALVGMAVARISVGSRPSVADSLASSRRTAAQATPGYWRLALYFALVTASHGVLDACTNGGLGIAFFAPFSAERFFFPWTPIDVSPIGLDFFSHRGVVVAASEMRWVWLPALVAGALGRILVPSSAPVTEGTRA